jgi:hypothetical protein
VVARFAEVREFSGGVAAVAVRDGGTTRWGLLRANGTWLARPQYDDAAGMRGGRALLQDGDAVLAVRADGTRERVAGAAAFRELGALVTLTSADPQRRLWLEGPQGRLTTARFDPPAVRFDAERAWVKDAATGLWGLFGPSGEVLPPTYKDIDREPVRGTGLWGVTDGREQCLVSRDGRCLGQLEDPRRVEGDPLVILREGKRGLAGRDGRLLLAPRYDEITLVDGNARLKLGDRVGLWTRRHTIEPAFDDVAPGFRDGRLRVKQGGRWGFVDAAGKPVIPAAYAAAADFAEGRAAVSEGAKWGFIDRSGNRVIPLEHDAVGAFSGGLAPFKRGDRWGYLDATGKVVIEPQFVGAAPFIDKHAAVETDQGRALVDARGTLTPVPAIDKWIDQAGATVLAQRGGAIVCLRLDRKKGWVEKKLAIDEADAFVHGRAVVRKAHRRYSFTLVHPCGWLDQACGLVRRPTETPILTECSDFNERGIAAGRYVEDPRCLAGPGCSDIHDKVYWQLFDRKGEPLDSRHFSVLTREADGRFRVQEVDSSDPEESVLEADGSVPAGRAPPDGWRPVRDGDEWGFADASGRRLLLRE